MPVVDPLGQQHGIDTRQQDDQHRGGHAQLQATMCAESLRIATYLARQPAHMLSIRPYSYYIGITFHLFNHLGMEMLGLILANAQQGGYLAVGIVVEN